jgi:acetyl esterase/lipase
MDKKNIEEKKNISYIALDDQDYHFPKHLLDIYYPENKTNNPVLVFIHGGTWISGNKEIYHALGRNFADKGICCVIINYRLGDLVNVFKMAEDCAAAVRFVFENIAQYNGDPDNITLCGHSAGGHLASLITLDKSYFENLGIVNPVKKAVLLDAFGLNIGSFIENHGELYLNQVEKVFSKDPFMWKRASPVSFINKQLLPFFICVGGNTYPFIKKDNEVFFHNFQSVNPFIVYKTYKDKSHVAMIGQLENPSDILYEDIMAFIESVSVPDEG